MTACRAHPDWPCGLAHCRRTSILAGEKNPSFAGLAEYGFGTSFARQLSPALQMDRTSPKLYGDLAWTRCHHRYTKEFPCLSEARVDVFGVIPCWTGWTISGTVGFEGAGTSGGPRTIGFTAAGSSGCLEICLRKTQEPCAVFVFEQGCQEDCCEDGKPGGADGEPLGVCHPLSVGSCVP